MFRIENEDWLFAAIEPFSGEIGTRATLTAVRGYKDSLLVKKVLKNEYLKSGC
jgi:hypothetical protein